MTASSPESARTTRSDRSSRPAESVVEFHHILSDDGTRLRAWTNDPLGRIDGPTVLLCNGLGVSPWTWPALLHADCGVRVVSWNHRGTGGSARPHDTNRVGIEEFVEDALSVMDHFGVDQAVVMGWSMGVNTAFELALRHPERVTGDLRGRGRARRHVRHHARPAAPAARRGAAAHRVPLPGDAHHRPGDLAGHHPAPVRRPRGDGPHPLRLHAADARQRADRPRRRASSWPSRSSGTSTSPCAPPSTPASR